MSVQTLILLFDTDEDEFTQLKVILESSGNVLPSAGDDNVGGAGVGGDCRVKFPLQSETDPLIPLIQT